MRSRVINTEPPKGSSAEQSFIETFENRFRRAENDSSEWRQQAIEFYRTYGGDPFPAGVREAIEERGSPTANFNYSLAQVNAVLGQDIADRKEPRYLGQAGETFDEFGAEAMTKVVRAIYLKTKAHREETEAHQDQLVTGMGWSASSLDVLAFPVWPKLEAIDCREMYWDPDAKKNNLRDARWVARRRKMYLEDAVAMWPEKEADLKSLSTVRGGRSGERVMPRKAHASNYRDRKASSPTSALLDEDHLYIVDYQFTKPVSYVVYTDPEDGKRKKLERKEYLKEKARLLSLVNEADGVPLYTEIDAVDIVLRRVFRSFVAAGNQGQSVVIQPAEELESGKFTYQCATGYRAKSEDGRIIWFGLMSIIYEPQLWVARVVSASLEHIGRSPRGGGGFFNPAYFENPETFIKKGHLPGNWTPVKEGFKKDEHAIERQQPQFPQAYEKLFEILVTVIPKLTTVSEYFQGSAITERSNVLVTNLQGQTEKVLLPLLDPMVELRIMNATNVAILVQQHVARDDFNRLCGPMECEGVTFDYQKGELGAKVYGPDMQPVKIPVALEEEVDEETGEPIIIPVTPYDVVAELDLDSIDVQIELGPASATQKTAVWQGFTQTAFAQKLMELYPEAGAVIVPLLIENTPGLPTDDAKKYAEEIRRMIDARMGQGTVQAIVGQLQALPPDQLQGLLDLGNQMLMQMTAPQPGAEETPAAGAPPQA